MRQSISTDEAPDAIGPYSQAIKIGDLLFVSGQIALDTATGRLVDDDIEAETRQVMNNLGAILTAAGVGFGAVVRTTIYLIDLGDFPRVNQAYGAFFGAPFPARATVGVAALPRGARIEIDAIASLT